MQFMTRTVQSQFIEREMPEQPKRTLGQRIKDILIFPVPVTRWLMRDRGMAEKYPRTKRIGFAAGAWAGYFMLIGMFGTLLTHSSGSQPETQERMMPAQTTEETAPPQTIRTTARTTTAAAAVRTTGTTAPETTSVTETEIDESVLTPAFKAMMDSYEAFFDEYIAFVQRYSDGGEPISMLNDYLDWYSRYMDYLVKLAEAEDEAVTTADVAYYIEVNARILKKLADLEASLPDDDASDSFDWGDYDTEDPEWGDFDWDDFNFDFS